MAHPAHEQIITFRGDTTLRWSCRRGDFIFWLEYNSLFSKEPSMADFWEMRDWDFVTITNRADDLAVWFELHPSEVQGELAHVLMDKLNAGWQPPDAPLDCPNLWRLKAGDRVAWVGHSRPGQPARDGILAILDCSECALAIGETNRSDIESVLLFGSLSTPEVSPTDERRGQNAVEAVRQLGAPRTWGPEWALG